MREHGLEAPQRANHPHSPKAHDGTIIPEKLHVMWDTDLIGTMTVQGAHAAVFVAVYHYSGEYVGIHTSAWATRFQALEQARQGIRECFSVGLFPVRRKRSFTYIKNRCAADVQKFELCY